MALQNQLSIAPRIGDTRPEIRVPVARSDILSIVIQIGDCGNETETRVPLHTETRLIVANRRLETFSRREPTRRARKRLFRNMNHRPYPTRKRPRDTFPDTGKSNCPLEFPRKLSVVESVSDEFDPGAQTTKRSPRKLFRTRVGSSTSDWNPLRYELIFLIFF